MNVVAPSRMTVTEYFAWAESGRVERRGKAMRRLLRGAALAAALLAGIGATQAQDAPTIGSLLGRGFVVVSTWMTPIGPSVWLQNGPELYFCVAQERPDTQALTTQYCKKVE